ncbi:MAG: hypothetical protein DRH57_01140 [Candidatus Cloacimonadota bacterium]|nr:MAG: hypothetical protein DRH57_01140 [Candidatus Cloacimonadota bacterium]
MKKKQSWYLLTLLLMFLTSSIAIAGETKLEMYLWNRYTYEKDETNTFSLERGYFRLNHTFSDDISGRFNLDFFSSDKDEDVHGVGVKLKYAYLDFKNLIPIPESKFTFGLLKNYFGTIYDWTYVVMEKAPSDKYKFISSTDYGIALYGYIPNGMGEYALAVTNGEGYKKAGDNVNTSPAYLANLRFIPISGITIGGSYYTKKKGTDKTDYSAYAAVGRLAFGPLDIQFEFLSKEDDGTVGQGFMIMPIVKLTDKFELVARYDNWEPNTDEDNDKQTLIIGGINYYIMRRAKGKPAVMLQVNYENTSYEDSSKDSKDKFIAQLRWEFSTKL